MKIAFITTGGTIDKVYFDAKSSFEIGESVIEHVLRQGEVIFDYQVVPLMRKDSLEITDQDRQLIRTTVENQSCRHIVISHGTDTMAETGRALAGIDGKVIVLTGALNPARFQTSDAEINIGLALGAVQTCPEGVYLAMNGCIFDPGGVRKNREKNRFEQAEKK
jgi:L-asparaginase